MNLTSANIKLDRTALGTHLGAVYDYWSTIKKNSPLPSWSDMDMMALPLVILPWCAVVDVLPDIDDFRVRFWGTERVRLQGDDYTGKQVSEFSPLQTSEKVRNELREVVEQHQPMLFETTLETDDKQFDTTYQMLRLPFGDADKVDIIISAPKFPKNIKAIYEWFGMEVPISVLKQQGASRKIY
jgi:hypothetical protein